MKVHERFLRYAKYDTQSDPESKTYPSTAKQITLLKDLKQELDDLGVDVKMDNFGYVIGKIKANINHEVPTVAFIAHVDTSPDASGKDISPRTIYDYDGKDIILNEEIGITLSPDTFKNLKEHVGEDLIVTDGLTLLGADDKAGVAEIMTFVDYLHKHPNVLHGDITIVFTPDEEVGHGTKYIDIDNIDADFAYTLDGSYVGELAYENFNAAGATVIINGKSVHPGSAKHKMLNSLMVAMEFDTLLPTHMRPEITEKYEGFNHLHNMAGNCEKTVMKYIIRNHDKKIFAKQKEDFLNASAFLNKKYGKDTCYLEIEDSYYNMREKLEDNETIINIAMNAIKNQHIHPVTEPIRGGTDGARLTYMGLPCPNLGTGGYNFHGPYEYLSINEMEKAVEILKDINNQIVSKEG